MTYKVNYSLVETLRVSIKDPLHYCVFHLARVRVLLDGRGTRIEFPSKLINLF